MDLYWLEIDILFSVYVYVEGYFGLVLYMEVYGVMLFIFGMVDYI